MAMNKRGAEMTISTIVVIVLVLVVLIVVIVGFTSGWSNLWDKVSNFAVKPNVASVVQACQTACTTSSVYDYCVLGRTVTFGVKERDADKAKKYTCKNVEAENVGLELCGNVDCTNVGKTCAQWNGEWLSACTGANPNVAVKADLSNLAPNDASSYSGQKCCLKSCVALGGAYCANTKKCSTGKIEPPSGKEFSDYNPSDPTKPQDCCRDINKCV